MPARPNVIVLGLGIAGSSIAATLAQRGFKVTGIEQFSALHERGSSHGDTRIFRRVPHEGKVYVGLANASYEGWRTWNRMSGHRLLVECGGIDAGPEQSRLVQAAEELSRYSAQPCTVMTGKAFNREHSHFKLPADWRVVYQPASGVLRPDATWTFLHELARNWGAKLVHGKPALAIDLSGERVTVRTDNQNIPGDFLVVVAGSWLPKVFPELQLRLTAERRVTAWHSLRNGKQLDEGGMPVFCLDADGGWYGMPTPDSRVKIGHDKHARQQIDPDLLRHGPDDWDAEFLSRCVSEYLMGFDEKPGAIKNCIYTLTPDHHFLIDRHPSHSNVLLFSCCSGHGFKYAPAYGVIAADMIEGKLRPELDLFRLERGGVPVTRFS